MHIEQHDDVPSIERRLAALREDGHTRTRATELAIERAVASALEACTVVLVEGLSDHIALETLARVRGQNLRDEGIEVVAMGGATNAHRFISLFGPHGRDLRLAGLYDSAEGEHFRRSLARAGMGDDLESRGFFMCVRDLEDELIRCLGGARIEGIIESQGELSSLRRMQNEPFHRGRTHHQQLHRFLGVHSGRKYRYARLLAEALDPARVPAPLDALLAWL